MHQVLNKVSHKVFGYKNNNIVYIFKLENIHGNYVELTNYGAALKSIVVPDRYGKKENIILGYPSFEGYESDTCYIGSTIGPFANRIAKALYTIDENTYFLDKNDGQNNNHSGSAGFNSKVFDFEIENEKLIFTLDSPDGEGGFPGNLKVKVIYKWSDSNELSIEYFATTDMPTPINLTNHAYFNLTGGKESILNHKLSIISNQFLECTEEYIPTGNILSIEKKIIEHQSIVDVIDGTGHNNYFILDKKLKKKVLACILTEDISGRSMNVYTSYPGVQFYSGEYLNSKINGTNNRPQHPFDGLCLECQYYPDSPNHLNFPNTLLLPKNIYNESITYSFGIKL